MSLGQPKISLEVEVAVTTETKFYCTDVSKSEFNYLTLRIGSHSWRVPSRHGVQIRPKTFTKLRSKPYPESLALIYL